MLFRSQERQKIANFNKDALEIRLFFTLDDIVMANEKDEFIYHEMIVHTPMSIHPNVKNVLVIGGGDGGSVRELSRYPSIKSIDMVEIDERVVKVCQKYFPYLTSGLKDERVNLMFEDGLLYIQNTKNMYDLIIVDSTDPIGPGEGLFTQAFYQAFIPTYPSGHWLFGFASMKYHPIKDFQKSKIESLGYETLYYNKDIHVGSFALPNYVKTLLNEVKQT